MYRLLTAGVVVLLIAAVCLSFGSVPAVSACGSTNSAALTGPNTVTWVSNAATFELEASWATTGTPFIGVMENLETVGINSVEYDPLYFFPSSCDGSLTIEVEATKGDPEFGHVLNTRLQVGPTPYYAQATWVVTLED